MIRVLQVVDNPTDHQNREALRQLRGVFSFQITRVDLRPGWSHAVRQLASLRRHRPTCDIVLALGDRALMVAALGSRLPIIFFADRFPDATMVRWLRAVRSQRAVEIVLPTETARRHLVERGLPIDRCHAIPPGVDFGRIDNQLGRALREKLGFGPADRVLLAIGESTRAADHARAVWTAVILHVLDRRYRILIWGRGPMAESVRRFAEKLRQPGLLTVATDHLGGDVEFDQLPGAADIALVTAAAPAPTLPIAMCMAAALPIVAVTDPTICELLEDRHNALLCATRRPRQIARRLLDALDDPDGQYRRCEQARGEAYERFSRTRFVEAVTALIMERSGEQGLLR